MSILRKVTMNATESRIFDKRSEFALRCLNPALITWQTTKISRVFYQVFPMKHMPVNATQKSTQKAALNYEHKPEETCSTSEVLKRGSEYTH